MPVRLETASMEDKGHVPELRLWDAETLLAVLRTTGAAPLPPAPVKPPEPPRLSRFALFRFDADEGHMVLECPAGQYRILLHSAEAAAWLIRLGYGGAKAGAGIDAMVDEPQSGTDAEKHLIPAPQAATKTKRHEPEAFPCPPINLSAKSRAILLEWLTAMGALSADPDRPETEGVNLAHWEFHDLQFHAQSRPGRRTGRIRPYRWRGIFEPLPITKPPMGDFLPLPSPTALPALTLGDVLASRRSRRTFSEVFLPLETLSAFLGHACRLQEQRKDELGGISFRPSPSAGALHGLELYLLAERCLAVERGLYHYDPLRHGLERLPLPADAVTAAKLDLLAEQARRMAASARAPQAYFITTARFRRYQWKYAQLAYSVMLKDLGCLHQTMSLAAEALGLSSVILGDTPAEPFQSLTGLPWIAESPTGSFSLGCGEGKSERRRGS